MKKELQISIIKELMSQLDEGRNVDAGVQFKMQRIPMFVLKELAESSKNFSEITRSLLISGDLPLPGSYLTTDDIGVPILATRDKDGVFHAFRTCRHRSESHRKSVAPRTSSHALHHWSYANTGNLLTIPNNDHFGDVDKSCIGLVKLPALEKSGLFWVHLTHKRRLMLMNYLGP